MGKQLRILIIEDSIDDAGLILRDLIDEGYEPLHERVETAAAMGRALRETPWDVIVSDCRLQDFDCLEALAVLKESGLDIPFIVFSDALTEEIAAAAVKAGAHDCIAYERRRFLIPTIERELKAAALRREHKRMQAVIGETEAKFRFLVESAPDAVYVHVRDRLVYLNPAAVHLFGAQTAEELLGTPVVDRIHPDYHDIIRERIRLAKEEKKAGSRMEQKYLKMDGTLIEVEVSAVPVTYENGDGALVLLRDIGERKRAEEEKRRSAEISERLVGEMAVIAEIGRVIGSTLNIEEVYERFAAEAKKLIPFDGVSVNLKNPDEEAVTITYVSGIDVPERRAGSVIPLTGTFSAIVMKTRKALLFTSSSLEALLRIYPDLTTAISNRAGVHSNMVVPLISQDRVIGTLHFRAMKRNAYSEEDLRLAERIAAQIAGAIASAQLFADLKKTEVSLRISEERFRAIFDQAAVGVAEVEIGTGRFLMVNRRFCELVGMREAEMLASTFLAITHPEDREAHLENIALLAAGKIESFTIEKRYIRKDGKIIWVSLTISPLWKPGEEPLRNLIVVQDVTERRRAEEERLRLEERLRRAEKMEALGTLAGGVAHDLNNILGVLVGYAELLQDVIPEGNPLRKYASNILQSSLRGSAIIQDLLTLARRGVAVSRTVNLNRVISEYFQTPEFEKLKGYHRQVAFRSDLDPDLMNIKGSPVHLAKTVVNLLSNAAEAISDQGEVLIATENRYLDRPIRGYDEVKKGTYAVLTVSDSGQGIAEKDIGKIFEPFYTKKVMGKSGSGLGLAVVWGTVKDHDGYINVESEEGKGSVFTLYFPVTPEAILADRQPTLPESYRGKGEAILVVDDVPEQREMASSMLKRLGYTVQTVASGEEAVVYLQDRRADLLVLDMIMDPGMDGLETYRKILEINPKQKVVIVSGFSETGRVRMAQELGAGAYVRKPYTMEKIGLAVREELNKAP